MKRFLQCALASVAVGYATLACAADPMTAKSFIDGVASQVLDIVKDTGASKADKQTKLETVFADKVDIAFVAKFVLGKHWREATPAQQEAYTAAYKPFILKNYASKLTKYSGQTYQLKNPRTDGDAAVVTMVIKDTNGQDIYVDYRLREDSPAHFRVVDIMVEGVSLLTTQRSEFDSIVQAKGVDGLIEALQKQVAAKSA